jgi:hypothetical protein
MPRKLICLLALCVVFVSSLPAAFAQGEMDKEGTRILRKAKERGDTMVAIKAYLAGDILEVDIIAAMKGTKPRIYNLTLVGPGLGRLSAKERKVIFASASDKQESFPTEDASGSLIRFSRVVQEKKLEGAQTRELHKFVIPAKKIIRGKPYELRVKIEGMQDQKAIESFDFELKGFAELFLNDRAPETTEKAE